MKKRFSKKANRLLCVLAALMLVITSISIGVVADSTTNPFPDVEISQGDTPVVAARSAVIPTVDLGNGVVVEAAIEKNFDTHQSKLLADEEIETFKDNANADGTLEFTSAVGMFLNGTETKNFIGTDLVVTLPDLETTGKYYIYTYGTFSDTQYAGNVSGDKDGEPMYHGVAEIKNGKLVFPAYIGRGNYVIATFAEGKAPDSASGKFTVTYEHPQGITGTVPQDAAEYTENQYATVLDNNATVTNRAFTGWTVKGSADVKVYKAGEKIAVPESGLTLVSAWDTTNVPFFLHKNSTVQVENGQTQYPSEFFTPHGSMSGQVSGIAFVTGAGELIKDGKVGGKDNPIEEEVTAAVAKFADVQKAITVVPNNATMQNVIKVNFGDNVLADYNKGKIDVLWYVVKNGTNDSCPFHVDGVLYNAKTGEIVKPASYKYTVEHRYYTQLIGEEIDDTQIKDTHKVENIGKGKKVIDLIRIDGTVRDKEPSVATKATLNVGPGKNGGAISDVITQTKRSVSVDGSEASGMYDYEYEVSYGDLKETIDGKERNVKCTTLQTVTLLPDNTNTIVVNYVRKIDGGRVNYLWYEPENAPTDVNGNSIPVNPDFVLPYDGRLYYESENVVVYNPFYEGWRIGSRAEADFLKGTVSDRETMPVLNPSVVALRDEMVEGYRFMGWTRKYYPTDDRLFSDFEMAPGTVGNYPFANNVSRIGNEPDGDSGETLVAKWAKLYKVTYEMGENVPSTTTGDLPTDNGKYVKDDSVTLATDPGVTDSTNPNNKLIGWIIDGTFYELGKTITMPDHDVVAKGVWEGDVKYDANFPADSDSKGTAPTDGSRYEFADNVTVLGQNDMTVTGYEFKGWQLVTGKDENGHDIVKPSDRDDGLWLSTDKVGFDYNYTFKGVWAPKDKVAVTFYAGDYRNDRLVVVSRQSIDPTANKGTGEEINVPNTADVSRNYNYSSGNVNYLFNGTWSKEADGNATEIPKKTTENLNFYARYNTTTIPGVVTSETTAPNTPPPGVITTAPDDQNRESAATTPQNPTQPTRPGTPDETGVGGVSPNEGGPNTLVEDITGNPPAATPVIAPVVNTPATIGNIVSALIGNLPAGAVVGPGTIPAALPTALLNEEDIGNNLTPTGGLTPEEDIGSNRIPVAAGSGVASWALLNLLLAIATLAGCVFRVIGYFTNKKHPESDEAYAQASADTAVQFSYGEAKNVDGDRPIEDEKIIRRKALARLFSIVPAVIAIVTFFLTEDVTQPMVLIDKYTLFMMAIAIVQLVVALVFSKKKLKKDDDNKGGMDKGALANA